MKIVRFSTGRKTGYGVLDGESVAALQGSPFRVVKATGERYRRDEVRLLASCRPSKIVAIGLNYRSHAEEMGNPLPETPLTFLKPSTAVIGPDDEVLYPTMSSRVDFEGELGVVIGKLARRISRERAMDYVFGYTCFNDVTARDLQSKDGQWTRAKGFDTFAAMGPHIETDLDPDDVPLETRLNGEVKQRSNTSDLIFSVAELIAFVSSVMTLLPGDVIATGTPSGVGPMQVGDTVEVELGGIGVLRNRVAVGR